MTRRPPRVKLGHQVASDDASAAELVHRVARQDRSSAGSPSSIVRLPLGRAGDARAGVSDASICVGHILLRVREPDGQRPDRGAPWPREGESGEGAELSETASLRCRVRQEPAAELAARCGVSNWERHQLPRQLLQTWRRPA